MTEEVTVLDLEDVEKTVATNWHPRNRVADSEERLTGRKETNCQKPSKSLKND